MAASRSAAAALASGVGDAPRHEAQDDGAYRDTDDDGNGHDHIRASASLRQKTAGTGSILRGGYDANGGGSRRARTIASRQPEPGRTVSGATTEPPAGRPPAGAFRSGTRQRDGPRRAPALPTASPRPKCENLPEHTTSPHRGARDDGDSPDEACPGDESHRDPRRPAAARPVARRPPPSSPPHHRRKDRRDRGFHPRRGAHPLRPLRRGFGRGAPGRPGRPCGRGAAAALPRPRPGPPGRHPASATPTPPARTTATWPAWPRC